MGRRIRGPESDNFFARLAQAFPGGAASTYRGSNDEEMIMASDNQDIREKMREALERKKERHHATAEGAEHDGSDKSHGADGPIEVREFRRKSV